MKRKNHVDETEILSRASAPPIKRFTRFSQVQREHNLLGTKVRGGRSMYDIEHGQSTAQKRLADKVLGIAGCQPEETGVIDFGCGTGLSGAPFIEKGYTVDGVDFSPKMIEGAKEKGYRSVYARNLASGPLRLRQHYDIAISCGVAGDWIPAEILLRKMIGTLRQMSVIGFTSEASTTDMGVLERMLGQHRLEIAACTEEPGCEGKMIMPAKYYFVVAERR